MSKIKKGRPPEGRKRINLCIQADTIKKIDAEKDAVKNSRGKVIESKF